MNNNHNERELATLESLLLLFNKAMQEGQNQPAMEYNP